MWPEFCRLRMCYTPAGSGLLLISAVAVGLEQLAVLGIDNYCVPVAVGLLWSLLRR